MFFAQPIPATYASLFYLHLGANVFLISIMGLRGQLRLLLSSFQAATWQINMAEDG